MLNSDRVIMLCYFRSDYKSLGSRPILRKMTADQERVNKRIEFPRNSWTLTNPFTCVRKASIPGWHRVVEGGGLVLLLAGKS